MNLCTNIQKWQLHQYSNYPKSWYIETSDFGYRKGLGRHISFLHSIQTEPGTRKHTYSMNNGIISPGLWVLGFEYVHLLPHSAQIRNTPLPLPCTSSWGQICYQIFNKREHDRLQALQQADHTGNQSFVHLSSEYTDYRKIHQPLTAM
jgi:hypothetical protein